MKINYQTAAAVLILCLFFSFDYSMAQDAGEPVSVTAIPGGQVQVQYTNDPPTQDSNVAFQAMLDRKKAGPPNTYPVVPTNPNVPILGPSSPETAAASENLAPGDFQVYENNVISAAPSNRRSTIGEISVGANSNLVFATGNWYGALSMDHGNSWSYVDPTTQFPTADGGFCCDQEVIYDESRDMMIWLMQYSNSGTGNRYRIAVSVGHDNLARGIWRYYDFTSTFLQLPANAWADYPSIVLGNDRLLVTHNTFNQSNNFLESGWFAVDLDAMAAGTSANTLIWSQSTIGTMTPAQGVTNTFYWASHFNNTTLRVYRWTEGSSIQFDDVSHAAYTVTGRGSAVCPAPDGKDACSRLDGRIMAGYLANGRLGFAWMVAQGGGFPFPYTRFVRMNVSDRSVIDQPVIWNSNHSWLYPAIGVNDRGHIGGTLTILGGTFNQNIQAFISDDFNGESIPGEVRFIASGTDGPQCAGWGDYLRSRKHSPYGNTWIATSFTLNGGDGGACGFGSSQITPRVSWFGRERDRPVDDVSISNLYATLDGPYIDGTNGTSATGLNSEIPLSHPYCTSPWNYCGSGSVITMPTNIVDWGLIRLYAGHPSDRNNMVLLGQKVGLIQSNGRVVANTTASNHDFSNIWGGKYWIAFYHRNHLGVITDVVKNFENGSSSHSFRFDGSYGFNSQRSVDNIESMWGGDASGNGSVTSFDFTNRWLPQNGGPVGYNSGDFDLNGSVTAFDFLNVWLPANGRSSQAPNP